MSEGEGGKPKDATGEDDASLGEPVDLDSLAPSEPEVAAPEPSAASPRSDDASRAQAAARKLAAATGRRGALGRTPSTSDEAPRPGLGKPPTIGDAGRAALSKPATTGVKTVGASRGPATNPALSAAPKTTAPGVGRRPLVDPTQRVKKREPFYAGIRIPKKRVLAVVAIAVIGVGGWFGWKAIDHAQHADEYAVRDELFMFKFDHDDKHFAAIDGMGAKGVQLAIDALTDMRTVETSFGKSSTTTAELAHMYLMHYSQRVGVDPPPKALDVVKMGGVRQTPADWAQLKDLWGKWFADVQAKGKAR